MAGPKKSRSARDPAPPAGQNLLKRNFKRSVLEDVAPDGKRSLLKVFHAPGLGRLRDRGRARREERAHRTLRAAGLPCMNPLIAFPSQLLTPFIFCIPLVQQVCLKG